MDSKQLDEIEEKASYILKVADADGWLADDVARQLGSGALKLIAALRTAQERVKLLERALGYGRGYLQAVVDSKAALDKDAKDWEHAFVGALADLQAFSVAQADVQKGETNE